MSPNASGDFVVLLVEDNAGDARIIRELLAAGQGAPWRVTEVRRLGDALERLRDATYDAVLLDLALPDSTGVETVRRVCREAPLTPVVIMTGLDDEEAGMLAVRAGAQDYLVKGSVSGALLKHTLRYAVERKATQEELARLAGIVESSEDGIIGTDAQGLVRTWNAGAGRLFELTAAEIVGRPLSDIETEGRGRIEDLLTRALRGQAGSHMEIGHRRKGGGDLEVSLSIAPVCVGEARRVVGASVIARDVSPLKRAQELMAQAQKVESLGVLAGGVAHQFNNLFGVALGRCERALSRLEHGHPARVEVAQARETIDRAAVVSRQMVAFSGRGRGPIVESDLSGAVEENASLLRATLPPSVVLDTRLQGGLPLIEVDDGQLRQALANLVTNACEAIGEKKGRVTVITGLREVEEGDERYYRYTGAPLRAGRYVTLEVQDDGPGMDAPTLARIFDPFFSTRFVGRGLGLAMVLGIVRGHRGGVRVYSEVGRGTIITLLFPCLGPEPRRSQGDREVAGAGRGEAVLVIEDDPAFREAAADVLASAGFTALVAPDGVAGLALYWERYGQVRAAIVDLTMPGMGGEQVIAELHRMDPDLPVILISGFTEEEATRHLRETPLAGFVRKPFHADELVALVRGCLDRRRVVGAVGLEPTTSTV